MKTRSKSSSSLYLLEESGQFLKQFLWFEGDRPPRSNLLDSILIVSEWSKALKAVVLLPGDYQDVQKLFKASDLKLGAQGRYLFRVSLISVCADGAQTVACSP